MHKGLVILEMRYGPLIVETRFFGKNTVILLVKSLSKLIKVTKVHFCV